MTYKVLYERSFCKDIKGLLSKDKESIRRRIELLAENPGSFHHLPLKEKQFKGIYRLRVGNLRVFYKILHQDQILVILSVKHRREVYR